MKVEGCVIHRSMLLIPAAPLNLSLFTAGWCKLDSFLLPWLAAIFHEQCFHRHNQTRTQARWLLALAFPLQWWNTSSVCCLWWVVLNRTTCSTHTHSSVNHQQKEKKTNDTSVTYCGDKHNSLPQSKYQKHARGVCFYFFKFQNKSACVENVENSESKEGCQDSMNQNVILDISSLWVLIIHFIFVAGSCNKENDTLLI